MFWNYLKFLRGSKASHVGTATCTWLCALLDPSKPWCGRALRTGAERSARHTPVSSWRIVRLAQRVPALVEWLRCCSYAKTFINTFPQCGFLHWYPIMRWRIKCKCIHCGIKYINASQNNSYKKTCFADIKHTCIPHQNRILTVCWRHQRCLSHPSIHSNIENRRQVSFEHWICLKSTNQKKIDNPKSGW